MQELLNQVLAWVSLFVGTASLALAFYTIWLARATEREVRQSFQRSEDRIRDHYEKLNAVLAQIEIRSATTEQSVKLSQEHMLNTITNLLNEVVIPKKPDMGEQIGMQFMQTLMSNPSQSDGLLKVLKGVAEFGKKAE